MGFESIGVGGAPPAFEAGQNLIMTLGGHLRANTDGIEPFVPLAQQLGDQQVHRPRARLSAQAALDQPPGQVDRRAGLGRAEPPFGLGQGRLSLD